MGSARPKAFLKRTTPKKKDQVLETADDFQAAGVDFEDAAGKWRKGDPVKSLRFFQRAIEVYEQGLQRYPRSLDLAYNKARVELEIATHPLLAKQLQIPLIDALRQALASHNAALKLQEDNPDTLFNTAQVLTSIAEEIAKSDELSDAEAFRCLEEALELQSLCLSIQERKYEESQQQRQQIPLNDDDDDADDEGGVKLASGSTMLEDEDQVQIQWASIIEPVTISTLIETALAQLGTLTALCSLISNQKDERPSNLFPMIQGLSARLLQEKVDVYVQHFPAPGDTSSPSTESTEHNAILHEIALARAQFLSHIAESLYYTGNIDALTYINQRNAAFDPSQNPHIDLTTSFSSQLANGRSLISLASAIAADQQRMSEPSTAQVSSQQRWSALCAAQTSLLLAARITPITHGPSTELAETHALRGDISLMLYRLSLPPFPYSPAVDSAGQLLKNANVYYRNAAKVDPCATSEISSIREDNENMKIALFRADVVALMLRSRVSIFDGDDPHETFMSDLDQLFKDAETGQIDEWRKAQLEEMAEAGLISIS